MDKPIFNNWIFVIDKVYGGFDTSLCNFFNLPVTVVDLSQDIMNYFPLWILFILSIQ